MKQQKRIAIVHPFSHIDSLPSLCNTAVILADYGYRVDIFTHCDDNYITPEFGHENISVIPAYVPSASKGSMWRFVRGQLYWRYYKYIWLVQFTVRHLALSYICIIGGDPRGLVLADFLGSFFEIPVVYFSLELLLSHELITNDDRALKEQERNLGNKAAFIISQDDERAALLSRDNGFAMERILCVPNAPLGRPERKRSNYLREKFNIPADTTIVLNTGSLAVWSCIPQLIKSTQDWPSDWVLVIHTRNQGSSLNRDFVFALQCLAKPGRVIFSFNPIPKDEFPQLVQSADIGVAFYDVQEGSTYTQDNIRYMGLSSGKLAYYLQAGLPVLVNTNPSLKRLIAKYKCGEVVEDPNRTAESIKKVLDNYDEYSKNTISCFNKELDFSDNFNRVLKAVELLDKD